METKTKLRKVIKSGNALIITLPKDFTDKARLAKGDVVAVTYDGLLVIVNPNEPKETKNENDAKARTY